MHHRYPLICTISFFILCGADTHAQSRDTFLIFGEYLAAPSIWLETTFDGSCKLPLVHDSLRLNMGTMKLHANTGWTARGTPHHRDGTRSSCRSHWVHAVVI
jgi:hypothetical protein